MLVALIWGTLTKTRSGSVCMTWNSSRVAVLSAVINAPRVHVPRRNDAREGGDDLLERLQVHILLHRRLVDLDVRLGRLDLGFGRLDLRLVLVDALRRNPD